MNRPHMNRPHTLLALAAKFEADNITAARIVAADPDRYPGAMQTWAALVLMRTAAKNAEPATDPPMPLFEAA